MPAAVGGTHCPARPKPIYCGNEGRGTCRILSPPSGATPLKRSSAATSSGGPMGCPSCRPRWNESTSSWTTRGAPLTRCSDRSPSAGREVTVAKTAANAVMAGCLPEYFPVVLAATEAMLHPEFNLIAPSSSQGGAAVLVIVNGPAVHELDMNSGANIFGPGNRANATIGRAIRLVLMNACASIPGLFDRTVIGHPGKYTYCIAENETDSDWTPLHVERGLAPRQSAVTVFASWEPRQVRSASHSQEVVPGYCRRRGVCAWVLAGILRLGWRRNPAGAPGPSRHHHRRLRRVLGAIGPSVTCGSTFTPGSGARSPTSRSSESSMGTLLRVTTPRSRVLYPSRTTS